jgi:hypothetical protein
MSEVDELWIGTRLARLARGRPWLRGLARIEAGEIILDEDRAEEYEHGVVFHHPDILFDLTGVREPADALGFVRRYGLLWHGADDEPEHRESFADWRRLIERVNAVLELYAITQEAGAGNLEGIARLRGAREATAYGVRLLADKADAADKEVISAFIARLASHDLADSLDSHRQLIGMEISLGLQHSGTTYEVFPTESGFVWMAHADNLEGYVWHQIASIVTEQQTLKTCDECGRFFEQKDARQRFCTSQCAGRARHRRWREKQQSSSRRKQ